ncbi:MAG TPA: restriction endonuclease subunit S [Prolixibacteraceae bacterium]|jgi:type I restriction enzyme S subunit
MNHNWVKKRLGDICEVITKGTTPTSLGFKFTDEGVNFIKVESLTETGQIIPNKVAYISNECHESLKRSQLKENDILFSIAGALGRIGIVNDEIVPANTNQALAIVRLAKNSGILVNFLAKYFTSNIISEEIEKLKGGAAQQNLSLGQLNNLIIPLPPLSEQQRIVSILDEAFEAIATAKANAEQNLKNAKELFESYLQNVFFTKGAGWEEKSLGEIATFRNGMNFTKGSKGEVINLVGVRDFQKSFWVPFDSLDSVTIDGKLSENDFLKEGDILAVRSNGNPALIGRTLLAGDVIGKVSHSGFTIRVRLNSKNISSLYLCHFLKTQRARKELVESGTGVNIKSLNQGALSSLVISFPKSIISQQTIVAKLDALSSETKRLEAIYQQKIADLEELKKSVLQKAFSGEL